VNIFVTGIGVTTAAGINVDENLASLRTHCTGIERCPETGIMLGRVRLRSGEIVERFNLPELDYSRTSLLGIVAASEAWGECKPAQGIRTGMISATSVGGLDRTENYYWKDLDNGRHEPNPLQTHGNGRTTERIAKHLGINGIVATISTACSSGANAIQYGARLMRAGILDRVLVGGSDPLSHFTINGFSALKIYDQERCKPFDNARSGLNLGEGAAYLLLENERCLNYTLRTPLGILSGWNNSSDAYHQTASSADGTGATLAMKRALKCAQLNHHEINYINAHGTGTHNNDLSESIAIMNVFQTSIPPFSSTKGFTGHTLAAAGAIEAVYCILALQENITLPNLNFSTPMTETGLRPVTKCSTDSNVNHVLSNSFGFGGSCTSLIFSKP